LDSTKTMKLEEIQQFKPTRLYGNNKSAHNNISMQELATVTILYELFTASWVVTASYPVTGKVVTHNFILLYHYVVHTSSLLHDLNHSL